MLFQNANPLIQCIAKTPINKFYLNFIYIHTYIFIYIYIYIYIYKRFETNDIGL